MSKDSAIKSWLRNKLFEQHNLEDQLAALDKSMAVIEFKLDGTIITANQNFLAVMGYQLNEIQGQHHRLFVDSEYAASTEYREFWEKLGRGEFISAEFKRQAKDGHDVWIQASYNPILDKNHRPYKVIKYASDITSQKQEAANFQGQLQAISKSQAVIEFNLDGTIITANDNFLNTVDYRLDEIQGKHHRMFCTPEYARSDDYHDFWRRLNDGCFESGEFKRLGRNGKEVWISATYNPILDANGKPFKVVKFATDITQQKMKNSDFTGQLEAISKSQAVIEFDMKGVILNANDNFCQTVGYHIDEIVGRHHRMFVDTEYEKSSEYRDFWEKLNRGEFTTGTFQRFGKGNKEVWIQASYNPILDPNGKPYKVVKYATDITKRKFENANYEGQINAISQSLAVIEFNLDGTIITANKNFTDTVGYSLDEIKGHHHRMFVPESFANSAEYRNFWQRLSEGNFESGEFQRVAKDGHDIWLQASYNPILDLSGKPFKVVKYATEITQEKIKNSNFEGQITAIDKSLAVIEFNLDGTIIDANENFCQTVGYNIDEIRGQHHRMFVTEEYSKSSEYADFWARLNRGQFESNEYKRLAKGGREIWIQASYNPILDLRGNPIKVVKYATDITEQKVRNVDYAGQIEAISKSQAVIEFNMDGTIITANDNFLKTVGYSLSEIRGKHHRMFATPEYRESAEYREFWEKLNRGEYESGEYMRLGKGGKEVWIQASYNPILDLNGNPFKVVKYATDTTAEKLRNAHFERVKQALDVVKTNTIIADMNYKVVYINQSMIDLFKTHQQAFKQDVNHFDADNIIGMDACSLSKDPSHQRNFFSNLISSDVTDMILGQRNFRVASTPIVDEELNHLGIIMEWTDRTEIVEAEQEIDEIVKAAGDGDLSRRLSVEGKEEFFLNLSQGLNKLLTIADDVINDTIRVFDALAHGNLTHIIEAEYTGAYGKLKQDANTTVSRLTDIISRIRDASAAVSTGSIEISQGNLDLSKRTESQASSLEETASSMEEMTSAVKQTSENSIHANELAMSAKSKAKEGGDVVSKAVTAMDEINHASKKIADIIGVIDEIAFQTNLLALNAAVEAARAGEQGRGFAVVAGEVRNLAQRSAGAAKEIKDLIRDSVSKVDIGTALVNESGTTLAAIIESVDRVSLMIQEISAAASEQSSGIDQVNSAVSQMDEMTQQNAALVQQASAAGQAMAGQAQDMLNLMTFFDTSGDVKAISQSSNELPANNNDSTAVDLSQVDLVRDGSNPPMNGLSVKKVHDTWKDF